MPDILIRKTPFTNIRRLIQRHPALCFFTLIIGWSYVWWQLLFALLPLNPDGSPTLLHIILVVLGTSPSMFAVLLTYLNEGKPGLHFLFSKVAHWRVSALWYAAALLLAPGMNLITYLIYGQLSSKAYPLSLTMVSFGVPAGIMAAITEEIGWRGFALPTLQKRYSALISSLIVGLGWGIWHLPLFYLARAHYGSLLIPLLLLESLVSLTAISVFMTWVHNHTRSSLLLMILFHFSYTGGNFILQPPASSSGSVFLSFHLISAAVQWSMVAIVVALTGTRQLAREPHWNR